MNQHMYVCTNIGTYVHTYLTDDFGSASNKCARTKSAMIRHVSDNMT